MAFSDTTKDKNILVGNTPQTPLEGGIKGCYPLEGGINKGAGEIPPLKGYEEIPPLKGARGMLMKGQPHIEGDKIMAKDPYNACQ